VLLAARILHNMMRDRTIAVAIPVGTWAAPELRRIIGIVHANAVGFESGLHHLTWRSQFNFPTMVVDGLSRKTATGTSTSTASTRPTLPQAPGYPCSLILPPCPPFLLIARATKTERCLHPPPPDEPLMKRVHPRTGSI